jgi:flagellar motility protein MotE (MotC chaperone)
MLKGAASTLLSLIIVGVIVGALLMKQVEGAAIALEEYQGPVPEADATPIILLPEAGGNAEHSEPTDERAWLATEQKRLQEWERRLEDQQDNLDERLVGLGSREQALREEKSRLEGMLATLESERTELELWQDQLEGAQDEVEMQQAELLVGWAQLDRAWVRLVQEQRQAQRVADWGSTMLIAAGGTSLVHLAVLVLSLGQHRDERSMAHLALKRRVSSAVSKVI